jgi:hypothetical protein
VYLASAFLRRHTTFPELQSLQTGADDQQKFRRRDHCRCGQEKWLAYGAGFFFTRRKRSLEERAWYFNSWDSFFIPKPFARVVISFGEMIKFTPAENSATFESQRLYLEKIMRPELRIDPDKKSISPTPLHD